MVLREPVRSLMICLTSSSILAESYRSLADMRSMLLLNTLHFQRFGLNIVFDSFI